MAMHKTSCPVCEDTRLVFAELAGGLKAAACPSCKGSWVKGSAYFNWLDAKWRQTDHSHDAMSLDDAALIAPGSDSPAGKLCLDCGRYMRRVTVGHGKPFHLDRCVSCGGFWFDAGEWASLHASGMHRDAHQVFTDAWQAEVRREAREQAEQHRLAERLGQEGVARLEEIKRWVAQHPRGAEIIAALTARTGE